MTLEVQQHRKHQVLEEVTIYPIGIVKQSVFAKPKIWSWAPYSCEMLSHQMKGGRLSVD